MRALPGTFWVGWPLPATCPGEILDFLLEAGFSQFLFFSYMLVGVACLLEGMHFHAYCCPMSPEKGQA